MCTMGLHSVERDLRLRMHGTRSKGYTPRDRHWGVFGITVASILVDDFFAFSLCIATHCKFALWVFFGRAVTCDYNSLHCSG
jgi:hypothetical protein